jgi:hypothetical protein
MNPQDIYNVLVTESEAQQLPEIYKTDLTIHDKRQLETGTQSFIWILRTCGTHLLPLDGDRRYTNVSASIDGARMGDNVIKYYVFRNETLLSITYEEAKRLSWQP